MQKWREAPHFFLAELMIILWCFDRLFSIYCYRKLKGKVVLKMANDSYVIMLLKMNRRVNPGVGDTYYLLNEGDKQRSHPFTTFSNHNDKTREQRLWDIGFIITTMKEKGGFWCNPWTRWLQREDPEAL